MSLSQPLIIVALLLTLCGLILLFTILRTKKRRLVNTFLKLISALLFFALAALCGTITVAMQGYQALTMEELAATVKVEPTGVQMFTARFTMADGSEKVFPLAGDQLYIDAHILKWKPLANIFGLHTSYELDRIAGRYAGLVDETSKVHTTYSLAEDRPINMFDLRSRFTFLNPFLDAEYGSATFINSNRAETFNIMVSTSGLLIRKAESKGRQ